MQSSVILLTHGCSSSAGTGGLHACSQGSTATVPSGVRCILTAAACMVLLRDMQDTTSDNNQLPAIATLHHRQLPRKANRHPAGQGTLHFMQRMRDPTCHWLCCHCCMTAETAVSGTCCHSLEWFINVVHGCPQHMHERCWVYQEAHTMILYQLIKLALLVCMQQQQAHGASQAQDKHIRTDVVASFHSRHHVIISNTHAMCLSSNRTKCWASTAAASLQLTTAAGTRM